MCLTRTFCLVLEISSETQTPLKQERQGLDHAQDVCSQKNYSSEYLQDIWLKDLYHFSFLPLEYLKSEPCTQGGISRDSNAQTDTTNAARMKQKQRF